MADTCREKIISEDYADWLVDFELTGNLGTLISPEYDYCYSTVNSRIGVVYIKREQIPDVGLLSFDYQFIPDLFGLSQISEEGVNRDISEGQGAGGIGSFNPQPLIGSGILSVQSPPLSLTGKGVILAFADTGIRYENEVFRRNDGTSRILAIWDQTIQEGEPPEGFLYGTEYTKEEIDAALQTDNPRQLVPTTDEIGHGTRMASVAAGNRIDEGSTFLSPAYDADIVVVKMKQCKQYLRDYYLIPPDVPAYQTNDLMMAVKYLDGFARVFERPVIFCIGVGNNYGDHIGYNILARYLTGIASQRSRVMVLAGGNEGNAAHHYEGILSVPGSDGTVIGDSQDMEIRVPAESRGFLLQIWTAAPASLAITIRTPGGEVVPATTVLFQRNLQYRFVYESTLITVDNALIEQGSGDELILIRFQNPTEGIWTIGVTNEAKTPNTVFNAWLPISQFLENRTYFLKPNPEMTLTIPSYAEEAITVSTYDSENNSFYVNSGRGYSRIDRIKPDFAAPGVDISTVENSLRGRAVVQTATGSSLATAIAAGAAAQFMQWAVIDRNSPYIGGTAVKNYFIRGAIRDPDLTYPNRQWGYGRLDLKGVFDILAGV